MRPEFDTAYEKIREALPEIGRIRRAALEFCQYSSRYDKFKAGIVENAFDPKMKNSALADIGIYPLHVAISLFGAPKSINSTAIMLENGFLGAGSSTLGYDGMIADISYSKIADSAAPSVIMGEDGSILIDRIVEPTLITLKKRGCESRVLYKRESGSNMTDEIRAFRIMMQGKIDYKPYLELSERVMKAVSEIYRISGVVFPE